MSLPPPFYEASLDILYTLTSPERGRCGDGQELLERFPIEFRAVPNWAAASALELTATLGPRRNAHIRKVLTSARSLSTDGRLIALAKV
jgi:hypothetical protein